MKNVTVQTDGEEVTVIQLQWRLFVKCYKPPRRLMSIPVPSVLFPLIAYNSQNAYRQSSPIAYTSDAMKSLLSF